MKLMFAHDFPMYIDEKKNVYSKGGFPYSVWERYLRNFDKLTVVGRLGKEVKTNELNVNMTKSSGPNVNFVCVPSLSSIKGFLINKIRAGNIIEEQLKEADMLIARLPSEVGALAIKIAKRENIPYLVELVGCPYDALRFYGNLKGKIYAPISMFKTKRIIRNSNYTIYVTKYYLQDRYPTGGNQINISNVSIEEIDDRIPDKKVRKFEKINNRRLKIGMIGSINYKYKGFDKAIEYLSNSEPNSNNFEVRILGSGDKGNFKDTINRNNMKSKVFFDGTRSSGEEVFKWLDEIDLYIQPSLTEGLPRALIEALSRGCLAIGSEVGGIPELLENKYLFNPFDEVSFNESINNALASKENIKEQVYQNIKKASEYTIPKLSKRRNDFIRQFIIESR